MYDNCGEIENLSTCGEILRFFWEILLQFTRFHVEKNWAQKYICGEKMTKMRSDALLNTVAPTRFLYELCLNPTGQYIIPTVCNDWVWLRLSVAGGAGYCSLRGWTVVSAAFWWQLYFETPCTKKQTYRETKNKQVNLKNLQANKQNKHSDKKDSRTTGQGTLRVWDFKYSVKSWPSIHQDSSINQIHITFSKHPYAHGLRGKPIREGNTRNCDCDNEDVNNHAIGNEKTYKAKEVVRVLDPVVGSQGFFRVKGGGGTVKHSSQCNPHIAP